MEKVMLKELGDFVRRLLAGPHFAKAPRGDRATIVALSGDLGAGKTTFVQALARELGVTQTVQSPTYVIMKSYEIPQGDTLTPGLSKVSPFKTLVHIDLYRLEGRGELAPLKLEAVLSDPKNVVCVEWPERAEGTLPRADLALQFSSDGALEGERYIDMRTS